MKQLAVFAVVLALAASAVPQGEEMTAQKQQEMLKKWMAALELGPMHKLLEKFVGEWTTESTSMGQVDKGAATFAWAVKGRVLMGRETTTMFGKPVEKVSLTTWDAVKRKWVESMASSMHYGMLRAEGVVVDKSHRTRVTYGRMDEVLTGEHDKPVRFVTRWIDNDTFVHEVWDMGVGEKGARVAATTYKRKT